MVRQQAPAWMNVKNPLDVGPSGLFGTGLETVLRDDRVQGVMAIPVIPSAIIESAVKQGFGPELLFGNPEQIRVALPEKPVVTYTIGSRYWMSLMRKLFGPYMTLVSSAETAAKALCALHRYHRFRD